MEEIVKEPEQIILETEQLVQMHNMTDESEPETEPEPEELVQEEVADKPMPKYP